MPDFSLYVGTSEPLWPLRQAMLRAVALNLALLGLLVAVLLALGLLIRRQLFHVRGAVWSQLKVLTRQRERRLLSEVLRSGVMLTMVVDAKGNYVFSNAVFDQMFPALARQEMAAGEWIKKFLGLHRFEFASSRPYQIENSLSDAHGRWRHFSWTIWALKDASGQLRHFVVNGIDNTDRREAELTMYQANKLAQLGEMATALAHELSQPLGAMRLSVENLAWRLDRREADPAQVSRMLFKVGRQLDRAATIVDRMRTFGRKPNGNLGPVDPVKVLEVQRLFAGRS